MKQNTQNAKINNRCLENTSFCLSTLTLLATLILTFLGSIFFTFKSEPWQCFYSDGLTPLTSPTATSIDVSLRFKALFISGSSIYFMLIVNLFTHPIVPQNCKKYSNAAFKFLTTLCLIHTIATLFIRIFSESGKVCSGDYLQKDALTASPFLIKQGNFLYSSVTTQSIILSLLLFGLTAESISSIVKKTRVDMYESIV